MRRRPRLALLTATSRLPKTDGRSGMPAPAREPEAARLINAEVPCRASAFFRDLRPSRAAGRFGIPRGSGRFFPLPAGGGRGGKGRVLRQKENAPKGMDASKMSAPKVAQNMAGMQAYSGVQKWMQAAPCRGRGLGSGRVAPPHPPEQCRREDSKGDERCFFLDGGR